MHFKDWLDRRPRVWKKKDKPKDKKKDRRKFMSKMADADEEDLDGLADEMGEKGYKFKKKSQNDLHKWLLERKERIARCLKLLSEDER